MAILRNIDIAKKYNVSPATVKNWIDYALTGKIKLETINLNNKTYIKDTQLNHLELQKLKTDGVKFRTKSDVIRIKPDPEIYKIFNDENLIDLILSISSHNHIPDKYSWFGSGATYWNNTYFESIADLTSGHARELNLIEKSIDFVLDKYSGASLINLVDVGPGNSHPVKKILEALIEYKKLNNYICFDLSEEILKISSSNIKEWFGINSVQHNVDFEYHSLRSIMFKEKADLETRNLYVYLGATLSNNFNRLSTLGHLTNSLNENDYILIATDLDDKSNQSKEFASTLGLNYDKLYSWVYKILNVEKYVNVSDYEYNESLRRKTRYFTLKQDVEIEFEIGGKTFFLSLEKDRKITFMMSYKYTLEEILNDFSSVGLDVEQFSCDNGTVALFLVKAKKILY